MKKAFYTTTTGKQFLAHFTYERDARERGYYATIHPVTVTDDGNGFYGVAYEPYRAMIDGTYERVILKPVNRASARAKEDAEKLFWSEVCAYFEKRGLIARRATLDELARETEARND